jgi:hypothetical protein
MNGISHEPVLVLSQDYELFFQKSGSVEKCLLEPCDKLLKFAAKQELSITFFVDVGMLQCYGRYASKSPQIARDLAAVRENLQTIARAGHELALHVHPHWEETRWVDGQWDFSGTRYQLRDFSDSEVGDIFRNYHALLQDFADSPVVSYRAGGFCIEPFSRIASLMSELGINVESSVVPGARLVDPDKGFDFASLPDEPWWHFDKSPSELAMAGEFLEIPVTPNTVSRFFYWGRLLDRLGPSRQTQNIGDGVSKAIGKKEILRRLLGGSRTSELSIDDAKAEYLAPLATYGKTRQVWHLMGHPKLLSQRSLVALQDFIDVAGIWRFRSLAALASQIRAGELTRPSN